MKKISTNNLKDVIKTNSEIWENIGKQEMNLDVNLVRCQKRIFSDKKGKRLLYIGFGEGQNLIYFARQGFDCFGTELSLGRVRRVRSLFKKEGLKCTLRQVASMQLPFQDNFFDVVVAWQSLYYNNKEGFESILREIYRVVKPGGDFLSSLLSPEHGLCGIQVSENIYRPSNTKQQTEGVLFVLKNKQEIKKFYKQFHDIRFGFYSFNLFKNLDFHHVIWCKK